MDNYFFMNANAENASSCFELTTLRESNSAQICAEICCLNHPGAFRLCLRSAALSQPYRSAIGVILTALMIVPLLARIRSEEALLRSAFGAEYDAYRARTAWRLIPGIY
jgi:hypothetical protein